MDAEKYCQSCTFPLHNPEDRGTEKDGSKSNLYCKYCYQDGAFTDPDMTLERMLQMAQTEMKKQQLPDSTIQQAVSMLPRLKRWQTPSS